MLFSSLKKMFFGTVIVGTLTLQSCTVHRHVVGSGPTGKSPDLQIYDSGRQLYLIGGLLPINQVKPSTPISGNYQIKTSSNIVDALIGTFTFGLIKSRTVKILVRPNEK